MNNERIAILFKIHFDIRGSSIEVKGYNTYIHVVRKRYRKILSSIVTQNGFMPTTKKQPITLKQPLYLPFRFNSYSVLIEDE